MVDLRWILEKLPVGVWVAEAPGGEVAYANPEFRTILGINAVPGISIREAPAAYGIFDRNGSPYPIDQLPFSRVVASGEPAVVDDLVIHRPDGRKINVRAFAYPTFSEGGSLSHVVVAFVDITQEVNAELERKQTEARLALAVTHAPIVVWATDAKGVVTLSEGAGLTSLGLKSGELVGKNLFEIYRDHPSIAGYLRRGLAGESFWYTVELGKTVYDTWLTPLRNPTGEITGVAGLSNDVSELRALQSIAIQNDRVIALGTLAASVAHEINNPLTYILGNLDFLRDTLDEMEKALPLLPAPSQKTFRELTVQMRKALEPTRSGTARIAGITRELRTFSRPAAEETGHVDIRSTVESVLKLMRKEIEARAHLEVNLQPTAPVVGNSTRLVQVVMNLTANAVQALPPTRTDTATIWISTRNEGSSVVIEVADTGPGVPPKDRERIFEPFVTTKDIGEGTGLGLFVCRNIVRDYSGKLIVKDRPSGGAVFRVELPAAVSRQPTPTATQSNVVPAESPRARILIIEDEPLVAEALARLLSSAGYSASIEHDPTKALEQLVADASEIDLVYCDLMMKRMSGMEFAEKLLFRAPTQLGKLVFMTGGAFTPRARAFRERFAAQCVEKPFDILLETSHRLQAAQKL